MLKRLSIIFVTFVISIAICNTTTFSNEQLSGDHLIRVGLSYSTNATNKVTISNSGGFYVSVYGQEQAPTNINVNSLTLHSENNLLYVTTLFGGNVTYASVGTKILVSSVSDDDRICYNGTDYRGSFEFFIDYTGKIVVINVVDVEDYLKGVLPSEVYPSWNIEALKTAAIVARTYALRNASSSSHSSNGFDICATTHCQMYSGTKKENVRTNEAILETTGLVIMYNGFYALTPYHSSNGGYTETSSGAWGGSQSSYPYLTSVYTPYEDYRNVPNGKWESIVSPADLVKYIPQVYASKLYAGNLSFDYQRENNGFIRKMSVSDAAGNKLELNTSGSVRSFFGSLVKSASFSIADTYIASSCATNSVNVITSTGVKEVAGTDGYDVITADGIIKSKGFSRVYVIDGQGYGHGVGLSQYGSRCMADAGFTYDQIISTYFPGTYITSISEPYNTNYINN